MYDDWQPMSTSNRYSNGNRDDERKPYARRTPNSNYPQNAGNQNNRNYSNYNTNPQNMGNQNNQPNQASINTQNQGQGPNVDMILREEAYNVVGCAINTLNELGPGLNVECYEKALRVEFNLKDIPYLENQSFPITYKEVNVGEFNLSLVAYETIIVLPVVADAITDGDIAKMVNHLKIAHFQAGLIFNFKYPKLQWQRVII